MGCKAIYSIRSAGIHNANGIEVDCDRQSIIREVNHAFDVLLIGRSPISYLTTTVITTYIVSSEVLTAVIGVLRLGVDKKPFEVCHPMFQRESSIIVLKT